MAKRRRPGAPAVHLGLRPGLASYSASGRGPELQTPPSRVAVGVDAGWCSAPGASARRPGTRSASLERRASASPRGELGY